jgi:hypothetical protein
MILIAALSALRDLPSALILLLAGGERTIGYLIGLYLIPFLLFFGGLALSRSRLVEEMAPAGDVPSIPSRA